MGMHPNSVGFNIASDIPCNHFDSAGYRNTAYPMATDISKNVIMQWFATLPGKKPPKNYITPDAEKVKQGNITFLKGLGKVSFSDGILE